MPGRDRTGPGGKGSMTGRGMGECSGSGTNRGRGLGFGRGSRRGFGFGRRLCFGYYRDPIKAAPYSEKKEMETYIADLEREVANAKRHLEEMDKSAE